MKKYALLLISLALIVFVSCKNKEKKADLGPTLGGFADNSNTDSANWTTIQWIDSVVDKGTITEGDKLEILFHFKNTGNKPLVIKEARPSCGCTVAEKPEEPIAPGKEGVIKAAFDSQNKMGPNHKSIFVRTNTSTGNYNLVFTVVVNKKS
ncbi:MAG: DUF1573 domain-containing protein [Bacteroidetes bacterium]|nr:MAG: DUF1573 domain-containing protein [Bacteroidota bacterium]